MKQTLEIGTGSEVYCLPIKELISFVKKGTMKLREVEQHRIKAFKTRVLENYEKDQVFLTPLVGHLDVGDFDSWREGEITMIDGSLRMEVCIHFHDLAIQLLNSKDQNQVQLAKSFLTQLEDSMLSIQMLQGWTSEQKDQRYLDFNR